MAKCVLLSNLKSFLMKKRQTKKAANCASAEKKKLNEKYEESEKCSGDEEKLTKVFLLAHFDSIKLAFCSSSFFVKACHFRYLQCVRFVTLIVFGVAFVPFVLVIPVWPHFRWHTCIAQRTLCCDTILCKNLIRFLFVRKCFFFLSPKLF